MPRLPRILQYCYSATSSHFTELEARFTRLKTLSNHSCIEMRSFSIQLKIKFETSRLWLMKSKKKNFATKTCLVQHLKVKLLIAKNRWRFVVDGFKWFIADYGLVKILNDSEWVVSCKFYFCLDRQPSATSEVGTMQSATLLTTWPIPTFQLTT